MQRKARIKKPQIAVREKNGWWCVYWVLLLRLVPVFIFIITIYRKKVRELKNFFFLRKLKTKMACSDDSIEEQKENCSTTTPLHFSICKSNFGLRRIYLPIPRVKETFPLGCTTSHAFIVVKDMSLNFHLFALDFRSNIETPSDLLLRHEIDSFKSPWEKWPEHFQNFLCGHVWKDRALLITANMTTTEATVVSSSWEIVVKTKLPIFQKVLALSFNDNFVVIVYLNIAEDPHIIIIHVPSNMWAQIPLTEPTTSIELSNDNFLIVSTQQITDVYQLELSEESESKIKMNWKHKFKLNFKDELPPYMSRYYSNERVLLSASTRGICFRADGITEYNHKNHNPIVSVVMLSHPEAIVACHDISNGIIFYKKDTKISTFSSDSLSLPSLILKFSIPRAKYRYPSLTMVNERTIGVLLPDGTFSFLEIK